MSYSLLRVATSPNSLSPLFNSYRNWGLGRVAPGHRGRQVPRRLRWRGSEGGATWRRPSRLGERAHHRMLDPSTTGTREAGPKSHRLGGSSPYEYLRGLTEPLDGRTPDRAVGAAVVRDVLDRVLDREGAGPAGGPGNRPFPGALIPTPAARRLGGPRFPGGGGSSPSVSRGRPRQRSTPPKHRDSTRSRSPLRGP